MGYVPDEYYAQCVAEAGPSPWLHLIRNALKLYDAGFGSKSQAALNARFGVGAAVVALNGHPLAFFGGMTRDPANRFPGDDRPESDIPDALEVLARKLDAPDPLELQRALTLALENVQALIDARAAGLPLDDAINTLEDWAVNRADLIEDEEA